MKKYVNGKLVEITDAVQGNKRLGNRSQKQKNVINYEERIKELENTVLELSAKLEKIETFNVE